MIDKFPPEDEVNPVRKKINQLIEHLFPPPKNTVNPAQKLIIDTNRPEWSNSAVEEKTPLGTVLEHSETAVRIKVEHGFELVMKDQLSHWQAMHPDVILLGYERTESERTCPSDSRELRGDPGSPESQISESGESDLG